MLEIRREIWEFDVDNTLIMWDKSAYVDKDVKRVVVQSAKGPVELVINQKNVNLLIKLAKIGYYIRVHSGSGFEWADKIVRALELTEYVDSVESKPRGKTDDKPPGEGTTYLAWRDPVTGKENS